MFTFPTLYSPCDPKLKKLCNCADCPAQLPYWNKIVNKNLNFDILQKTNSLSLPSTIYKRFLKHFTGSL